MPYTNNPYILQGQDDQQINGIQPMMQNIAQQQATQQMALQQQLANNQAAGQMPSQGGGANLALAMALRKDKKSGKTVQSDEMKKEIEGLGSNTWNPWSDYNTGANGWGNYGE